MNRYLKILIPTEIAKGLALTGKQFLRVFLTANRRPAPLHVVSEYPEVPAPLKPRFRGRLQLLKNAEGELACVCCMACEKICPTNAIHIEAGKKEGRKTRIPLRYDFEMERCVFCGFCVEACNFDAITLNDQFELATYRREDLALGLADLDHPSLVGRHSIAEAVPAAVVAKDSDEGAR
jgi:NADH-quinone oxidoreductase subunit I